ncbi:MAG: N-acetyltransferase [Clostridia bacterium]|nr:N-acetyltransferase [Clostridia bacterium]
MNIIIRNETPADYRKVEHLIREAFWNQNFPGCDEHYLLHKMRDHEDFIPELDLVLELNGELVGSIVYTKATLVDEQRQKKEILSFGPVGILPQYQRKGLGKTLMEASFAQAVAMGWDTVVIFGNPENYIPRGFKSCKKYNVCLAPGVFPTALLVKELKPGALDGRLWLYQGSSAENLCADEQEAARFDAGFPPKEKGWQPSQELFFICSHSSVVR